MDLIFLKEGAAFTLYALKVGQSVDVFLAELQKREMAEFARMMRRLDHMAEHGASPKQEEFNALGDGLFEAKSAGGARVIFFYDSNRIVLCAQGFMKKSRRTPRAVREAARDRQKAYCTAKEAGEIRVLVSDKRERPRRTPQ